MWRELFCKKCCVRIFYTPFKVISSHFKWPWDDQQMCYSHDKWKSIIFLSLVYCHVHACFFYLTSKLMDDKRSSLCVRSRISTVNHLVSHPLFVVGGEVARMHTEQHRQVSMPNMIESGGHKKKSNTTNLHVHLKQNYQDSFPIWGKTTLFDWQIK